MKKCNAKIEKQGTVKKCNQTAVVGKRLCQMHLNKLNSRTRKSLSNREGFLTKLKQLGTDIVLIHEVVNALNELYSVIGPFLSFAEYKHMNTLLTNSDRYERDRAARLLKASLARNPVIRFKDEQ